MKVRNQKQRHTSIPFPEHEKPLRSHHSSSIMDSSLVPWCATFYQQRNSDGVTIFYRCVLYSVYEVTAVILENIGTWYEVYCCRIERDSTERNSTPVDEGRRCWSLLGMKKQGTNRSGEGG